MDGVKTLPHKRFLILIALTAAFFCLFKGLKNSQKTTLSSMIEKRSLLSSIMSKDELKKQIESIDHKKLYSFETNEVFLPGFQEPAILNYTYEPALQALSQKLLNEYKPDLGVMVTMDAVTGRVLSLATTNKAFQIDGNPAIDMIYPSASVFKMVTATAALEGNHYDPTTMIPYAGRNTTLYKSQVLNKSVTGWRRISSLKEAFAKSINTVFGRIAIFDVGTNPLKNFSNRFGYNELIPSEFSLAKSVSANPEDAYELAQMASGFTQDNAMSPIHAAMMAASVVNDGVMMEPVFIDSVFLKSGKKLYQSEAKAFSKVMKPETARELKTLMRETVLTGTSRTSFRGFFKHTPTELEVGGKTGHLTDQRLKGRVDWFVGFAKYQNRKVSVAVLTMHKKFWTVKSSYLARRAIETALVRKVVVSR